MLQLLGDFRTSFLLVTQRVILTNLYMRLDELECLQVSYIFI